MMRPIKMYAGGGNSDIRYTQVHDIEIAYSKSPGDLRIGSLTSIWL